jgi:hypothetical protein
LTTRLNAAQGGQRQWRGAEAHSHRVPQGRALCRRGERR